MSKEKTGGAAEVFITRWVKIVGAWEKQLMGENESDEPAKVLGELL
jgi:hypothetical protein